VPQSITTNTLYYGDNLAIMREYIPDESVDLVYLGPRGQGCRPEDVKVGDTCPLTRFSMDGEYTSDTFSARRGSILPASVAILMAGSPET
jgi:hypothetical protein